MIPCVFEREIGSQYEKGFWLQAYVRPEYESHRIRSGPELRYLVCDESGKVHDISTRQLSHINVTEALNDPR